MKESSKKLWKWIIQILISAITGAGTAFGVSSCTVNSGNRENVSPLFHPSQQLSNNNVNNNNSVDTVKIIKETNTIYSTE